MLNPSTQQILGLFSPDGLTQLAAELAELYKSIMDLVEQNRSQNLGDDRQSAATRAALLISQIAEDYGDRLHKIKNKYPDYRAKIQENIAKTRELYQ